MTELDVLKSIDQRLGLILQQLAKTPLSEILCRPAYSCRELAQLSQTHGIQAYAEYTIRLACNDGRLPMAGKRENGTWSIPRDTALQVLQNGLPPERRNGRHCRSARCE